MFWQCDNRNYFRGGFWLFFGVFLVVWVFSWGFLVHWFLTLVCLL